MILFSTIATLVAVTLGLLLNASRAQVRGLARELNKKMVQCAKQSTRLLDLQAEVRSEKDKANTWEQRGLIAERDLRASLDQLFIYAEKAANLRERNRINKQKSRAKKKEARNVQ